MDFEGGNTEQCFLIGKRILRVVEKFELVQILVYFLLKNFFFGEFWGKNLEETIRKVKDCKEIARKSKFCEKFSVRNNL